MPCLPEGRVQLSRVQLWFRLPEPPISQQSPALSPVVAMSTGVERRVRRKDVLTSVPYARTLKPYRSHRSFMPCKGRTSMRENCWTSVLRCNSGRRGAPAHLDLIRDNASGAKSDAYLLRPPRIEVTQPQVAEASSRAKVEKVLYCGQVASIPVVLPKELWASSGAR